MAKLERILITGGGIAGLTLATALRRRGLDADLIERDTRGEPIGCGIAVQPNAMRVLDQLGVGDAVRKAGAVVRRWQFRDPRGAVLCDIDLEALWGEAGSFVGIERTKLNDALKPSGVAPRLGCWVTSLRQDERHAAVTFNDGTAGQYDLVVGADGIHSAMRDAVLGETLPSYGGQMVWRSLAPIRPPDCDRIEFWLGDGCFFGLCPVGGGTYGFANVTEPRRHDPVAGRLERLRRRFAGFGAPIQDYLAALDGDEQIHCGPLEWLQADRWHRGRVLLIGDAAHASSPMMGQGGSMAMEDALVLAELLQAQSPLETAIDLFIARRKPRVGWVQQQSRAAGEIFGMPPAIRHAALRERGKTAFHDRFRPLAALP